MSYTVEVINASGERYLRQNLLRAAALFALRTLQLPSGHLSIVLTTDEAIHQLNRDYLGHDYPTDILTFGLEADPLVAELYISVPTARQNAHEYGASLTAELLRLVFHGILHLAGWEDQTPEERQQMHEAENRLMEQFARFRQQATKGKN